MRVRKWSPAGSMKTWVFPFSRRNGFEWTIRSRSRWNGVRTSDSGSGTGLPRVSNERTANGDRLSSSARIRASNVIRWRSAIPTASG